MSRSSGEAFASPVATIFPSAWIATSNALSKVPATSVATVPPVPNAGSSEPFAR